MSTLNRPAVGPSLKVLRIIWSGLLIFWGVHLYQATIGLVARPIPDPKVAQFQANLFVGMGMAMALLALFLPRFILRVIRRRHPALRNPAPDENLLRYLYFIPWIFRVAFFESVSLFGFVAILMTGVSAQGQALFVLSLAGMLWSFSTLAKIRAAFVDS